MAADVRSCCDAWRAALSKKAHAGASEPSRPSWLEGASPDLADEVERRLDAFLKEAEQGVEELRAPAAGRRRGAGPAAGAEWAVTVEPKGEGEEEDGGVKAAEEEQGSARTTEGEGRDKAEQEEDEEDVYGIDYPARPFALLQGCRCEDRRLGRVAIIINRQRFLMDQGLMGVYLAGLVQVHGRGQGVTSRGVHRITASCQAVGHKLMLHNTTHWWHRCRCQPINGAQGTAMWHAAILPMC